MEFNINNLEIIDRDINFVWQLVEKCLTVQKFHLLIWTHAWSLTSTTCSCSSGMFNLAIRRDVINGVGPCFLVIESFLISIVINFGRFAILFANYPLCYVHTIFLKYLFQTRLWLVEMLNLASCDKQVHPFSLYNSTCAPQRAGIALIMIS